MADTDVLTIDAWEVLDSRGMPTVACCVTLNGGASSSAAVPSGASTGRHEAIELRDGGERYAGQGVRNAVGHVRDLLGPALAGVDATDQAAVDARIEECDPAAGFAVIGANATLAVSIATAMASASARRLPLYRAVALELPLLPLPMVNVVSGGAHAGGTLDIQDVLVIPVGAASFAQAIEWAWRARRGTAEVLIARGFSPALVADEGGFGPALGTNREALQVVLEGIEQAGLRPSEDVAMAIDVAANQLLRAQQYQLAIEGRTLDPAGLLDEIVSWAHDYPLVSVEDVLVEDDWINWREATSRLGHIQVLGDDLFVTDAERLTRGQRGGIANAILIKPNQTGTLTRALNVLRQATSGGYATVVSARSGETEDSWLADLAVGWAAGQIKVGSTMRSERLAKWNRLLWIEHVDPEIGYAGGSVLAGASHL